MGWLVAGLGGGMAMMLLVHLVQRAGGWVTIGAGEGFGDGRGWLGLVALAVVSALEEWFFRGLLFGWMLPRAGAPSTLAVTSLVFGLLHLGNRVNGLTVFNAVLAGFAFGAARLYTGGLGLAVGLHVGWNLMQWPLLGYPLYGAEERGLLRFPKLRTARPRGPSLLSGGRYGPEASLLDTAVFGSLLAMLLRQIGWL